MPVVPFVAGNAGPQAGTTPAPQPPPEEWALMAAAQMHAEDRLVEKAPDVPAID